MLAKTHGQPASPTKLGKEFKVFSTRIREQIKLLKKIPHSAKFGGATGNFNAHHVAFPKIQWKKFANDFVSGLGLKLSYPTTQIEHYDNLAALFNNLSRINFFLGGYLRRMERQCRYVQQLPLAGSDTIYKRTSSVRRYRLCE